MDFGREPDPPSIPYPPDDDGLLPHEMPAKQARPYQIEAIRSIHEAWTIYRSTLLVLATGLGKSYTAATVVGDMVRAGKRGLWIAHRRELITQAAGAISDQGVRVDIEMAQAWASLTSLWGGAQCVVASVDSLQGNRLARFARDAFDFIVIDEAHHATSPKYTNVLARFPAAKVLGLTATPDRSDGVGLKAVFDVEAFSFGIREGIREGFLSPIVTHSIDVADLDVSSIKTQAGDLAIGELERMLTTEKVLHQMASPLVREAGDRSTLVFTAGVAQAHAMVEVMTRYTRARCVAIDGTTPDDLRKHWIREYERGDVQFVFNCGIFTEGTDLPRTSCVAMARPSKSRSLVTQCIGRGLRLFPGKTECLVIDFVGNSGKHKLIAPLDVLAGKPIPERTRKDAQALEAKGMPSEAALAKAEAEATKRELRAEQQRMRREERARAEVAYRAQSVDMLSDDAPVPVHDPLRAERYRRGMCSPKQADLLARKGLDPDLTPVQAGAAISAMRDAGWTVTPWMRAKWGRKPAGMAAE